MSRYEPISMTGAYTEERKRGMKGRRDEKRTKLERIKTMIKPNPFTPKSGMEPRVFVGREEEVEFFKKQLEKARRKYYDHFLVRGDWGIGKTSLLKEYKNIAQGQKLLSSFVLASTFEGWEQFLQKHHPIGRYFTPSIKLRKIGEADTISSVDETLKGTGVEFGREIKGKIFEYTEGHPLELQILCSCLYDNQIGGCVGEEAWQVSLDATLSHMGEILLSALIAEASERERQILKVLAKVNLPLGWKEITREILRINPKFPKETIGLRLTRLVDKGLLKSGERGVYQFPDRLFREYTIRAVT